MINMRTYTRRRPECQVIEGVRDLCRLCLQKPDETIPIFDENSDNICATLSLRIMICVGLEMTREDNLPNTICSECYRELSRCYAFRKKCELSYQKLKLHIQALKNECIRTTLKENEHKNDNKIHKNDVLNAENKCNNDESRFTWTFEKDQLPDNDETGLNGATDNGLNKVSQSEDDNLDISTFLSSILVQLGVIVNQNDDKLAVVDPTVNTLELVMGDDNSVTLELVEEDEELDESITSVSAVDKSQKVELNYTEDNDEMKQAVPESLEVANGVDDGDLTVNGRDGCGAGGRAWCSVCRKWLASASTLRRHKLIHTGERPYSCRDCGRTFAQRDSLKRHRLVHLERRPFQCDRCVKSFTQRSALAKHVVGHAPPHSRALMLHRCSKCPKVFLYPSSLSRHMRVHYGFVFMCGACDRTFNDKSSLLRHVRNANHTVRPGDQSANRSANQSGV